jgi:hypothetical protein
MIRALFAVATAALIVSVAPAAAATPSVTTGPVTAVGPSTATVTGSVNPNGAATSWYVEYGKTTSYGSKSASKSAGSGTTAAAVSAGLTGLAAGTTYHYRVVATNGSGTARGGDGIFSTASAPSVTTLAASSVSPTSATLAGTVNPNGRETSWYFEYGTSTSYGTKTAAKSAGAGSAAVAVIVPLTGLASGRTFHFRLVATSDAGTSRGADMTFSTVAAPSAVTGSVASITFTSAKLRGTVNPNGVATNWYFEYGTSTSYGTKTAAKSAGSGTKAVSESASITGLKAGTTYHYRLVATNASGTTAGHDRTFSTAGAPLVRTGTAQAVGPSTAQATGTVDARGRHTTWYFEYGESTFYGTKTATKSGGSAFGAKNVSASISGLRPSTTYHFRVVASNDAGTSRGADVTFTTAGVTIAATTQTATYGSSVLLSGLVPVKKQGEMVTVYAQEYGEGSPKLIGTVATNAVGAWSFAVKPTVMTSYQASWLSGVSQPTVVGVRPAISLKRVGTARFTTRVVAGHSFARRTVKVQRQTKAGTWVTVKQVRLGTRSSAQFRVALPRGTSHLRIAMSVNQAGAGYLAGFSRTISVTKR